MVGGISILVRVVVAMVVSIELALGAVYKVGDKAGWTTIGNVDYKQWSALHTFQLGDLIQFEYNAQFHNVMQVTHGDYKACNTTSPKATFTSGNDSITITNRGHHFFICGVPGHCQSGQKLDINVPRLHHAAAASASASASSPAPETQTTTSSSSSSPSSSSTVPSMGASGPSPNHGPPTFLLAVAAVAAALLAFPLYI